MLKTLKYFNNLFLRYIVNPDSVVNVGTEFDFKKERVKYLTSLIETKETGIEVVYGNLTISYWRNGDILLEFPINETPPNIHANIQLALLVGISLGEELAAENAESSSTPKG